jgi:hypothetical protein
MHVFLRRGFQRPTTIPISKEKKCRPTPTSLEKKTSVERYIVVLLLSHGLLSVSGEQCELVCQHF